VATSTEAHAPSSYPVQPHELPDPGDITTEEDNDSSNERSDTKDEDLQHSSDSGSDSENGAESDSGKAGSSKPLTNSHGDHACQSIASPLPSVSHPIQSTHSTIKPPAILKSNPELAFYFSSLEDKVNQLESRVQGLESDAEVKSGELEAVKAHCALALGQIGALNKRLNKKKGKKS